MKSILIQNEEFLSTLGLTILHSLWLVSIIAGVVILILKTIRITAKEKYNIVFGAQILSLVSIAIIYLWSQQTVTNSVFFQSNGETISDIANLNQNIAGVTSQESNFSWNTNLYSWYLGCFWLIGLTILSIGKFLSWRLSLKLRNSGLITIPDQWQEKFGHLIQSLKFNREITMNISTRVASPVVIGYLKPMILVPLGFFSELSPAEIETVILHELAHVKRKDYLHLFIQQIINLVMFYHPAIWLMDKIAKQERENACDDFVVNTTGDPKTYARALGIMQLNYSKTQNKMAMNLLNDKNAVLNRLKRLVGEEPQQKVGGKLLVLPVILLISGMLLSFAPEKSKSIEPNPSNNLTESILPDHSQSADTSIVTLKEVKPVKVKEVKRKSKAKIKVVEVKEAKRKSSDVIVIEEIIEEPIEVVEIIVEQPERVNKNTIYEVEEVIEEEIPEIIEVILEEPRVMPDTMPRTIREEQVIRQLKELSLELEKLQHEMNLRPTLENLEKIELKANGALKAQIEAVKLQQQEKSEKMKAELAKLQAIAMREMAMEEKERALAMGYSGKNKISYSDLINTMNKDGLKMRKGDKIKFKVDGSNVYLDGAKLSDKLSKRYRELLWGYLSPGIKTGSAILEMTPKQTDITFKKK